MKALFMLPFIPLRDMLIESPENLCEEEGKAVSVRTAQNSKYAVFSRTT